MKNELVIKKSSKSFLPQDVVEASWMALSSETQKSYKSDMKLFLNFINKEFKNVTVSDISLYINHLKNNSGQTNSTINRKIASLSKLFSVYKKAGIIKENPVDVLKTMQRISFKVSKEAHTPLSLTEIKKAVKINKKDSPITRKNIVIIKTLIDTGMRISELVNMQRKNIEDISEKNYRVRIIGKGSKERFIFLSKLLYSEILENFPDLKNQNIFYSKTGLKYDRRNLWKFIKDHFFNMTGKEGVHPHMLRHFFATYKISTEKKDIKAVSKYLGHSDVSITLNMYVDTALSESDSGIKL